VKFNKIKELEAFVEKIDEYLQDSANHRDVAYPFDCVFPWVFEDLLEKNDTLLSNVAQKANVYGIFVAEKDSTEYILKYIGKTTKGLARERLKNHLIKKQNKTGAKLSKVIDHVQGGGKIKIAWVALEPESLRNYVEEELIKKNNGANWNRENK